MDLCYTGGSAHSGNETVTTGGVQLFVNMQTSVVGFVAIEVLQNDKMLAAGSLYSLGAADPLKGSATNVRPKFAIENTK